MALKFSIGNYYETYSENEELQRGDVIKKIDDYDTRDVRHVDAQNLLQKSERIKLVVERSEHSRASRIDTPTTSPMIIGSIIGGRAAVTKLNQLKYQENYQKVRYHRHHSKNIYHLQFRRIVSNQHTNISMKSARNEFIYHRNPYISRSRIKDLEASTGSYNEARCRIQ